MDSSNSNHLLPNLSWNSTNKANFLAILIALLQELLASNGFGFRNFHRIHRF
jgi:hypothetical protein